MKLLKVILIILLISLFINFIRGGSTFHIAKTLPFCGGFDPSFYDVGALCLILLLIWGLFRLWALGRNDNDDP